VSHVVLAEALWVLRSVYEGRREANRGGRESPSSTTGSWRSRMRTSSGPRFAHFKKRASLGFSGCLIVEIARKAGHEPLGTFDRDLAKVPRPVPCVFGAQVARANGPGRSSGRDVSMSRRLTPTISQWRSPFLGSGRR
jgi:hypothetical protein